MSFPFQCFKYLRPSLERFFIPLRRDCTLRTTMLGAVTLAQGVKKDRLIAEQVSTGYASFLLQFHYLACFVQYLNTVAAFYFYFCDSLHIVIKLNLCGHFLFMSVINLIYFHSQKYIKEPSIYT